MRGAASARQTERDTANPVRSLPLTPHTGLVRLELENDQEKTEFRNCCKFRVVDAEELIAERALPVEHHRVVKTACREGDVGKLGQIRC